LEAQSLNVTSNDFSPWEQQVVALSAITQSAALVSSLARGRYTDELIISTTVNSVLVLDPGSITDIYPNLAHLGLGFKTLQDMFSNDRLRENAELIRYTLAMLSLRNKLINNKRIQSIIRATLAKINATDIRQVDEGSSAADVALQTQNDGAYEQLATLYQDTISTLPYRIQVQGKADRLNDKQVANRIRALLLAGIRSAVLWHQLGGRRWRLVFYRKRIQKTAGNMRYKLIVSD
jgi:high frequency lysogenization protein